MALGLIAGVRLSVTNPKDWRLVLGVDLSPDEFDTMTRFLLYHFISYYSLEGK